MNPSTPQFVIDAILVIGWIFATGALLCLADALERTIKRWRNRS